MALNRSLRTLSLVLTLGVAGCAGSGKPPAAPVAGAFTLLGEQGEPTPLDALLSRSPRTVLLFFTAECPVQKAHDERMRATVAKYRDKGVAFYAVQAEAGADMAAERAEAQRRQIGMPLLQDKGAALADALGVEYSTHVVLLDDKRVVHYSGAEDSERVKATSAVTPYLEQALDAMIAGKEPQVTRSEPLGCPLRKH